MNIIITIIIKKIIIIIVFTNAKNLEKTTNLKPIATKQSTKQIKSQNKMHSRFCWCTDPDILCKSPGHVRRVLVANDRTLLQRKQKRGQAVNGPLQGRVHPAAILNSTETDIYS